jgi:hypothetical protein
MVWDVKEAGTIEEANFIAERLSFGNGGVIDTVSSFEEELSEIQ